MKLGVGGLGWARPMQEQRPAAAEPKGSGRCRMRSLASSASAPPARLPNGSAADAFALSAAWGSGNSPPRGDLGFTAESRCVREGVCRLHVACLPVVSGWGAPRNRPCNLQQADPIGSQASAPRSRLRSGPPRCTFPPPGACLQFPLCQQPSTQPTTRPDSHLRWSSIVSPVSARLRERTDALCQPTLIATPPSPVSLPTSSAGWAARVDSCSSARSR